MKDLLDILDEYFNHGVNGQTEQEKYIRCHGKYSEQQIQTMSIDKIEDIYNEVYHQRLSEINTISRGK